MFSKRFVLVTGGVFLAALMLLATKGSFAETEGENAGRSNTATMITRQHTGAVSEQESESLSGAETDGESEQESNNQTPKLSIESSGSVELHGAKLNSISGLFLSLNVFGLPLSVGTVASSTQFIGVSGIAAMSAGDIVSVKGIIDSSSGVIIASLVQDETQRQKTISDLQQQIQALLDQLHRLEAQINGAQGH